MHDESFESIQPAAAILKPHIAYYYFHQTHHQDGINQMLYYPNHQDAINIYRHADVQWDEHGRTITSSQQANNPCIYTSNQQQVRMVTMLGMHFKVGIIFNPLGLNHFIDVPFNQLIDSVVTPFDYFGDALAQLADDLYQPSSLASKQRRLDRFFVEQYQGFDDSAFYQLIRHMQQHDPNMEVAEMAKRLDISSKTVQRRFKQHLGYSPRTFKAVLRFRQALLQYQQQVQNSKPKLTEIGLHSAYYDQSDFIRQYKALVGLTPKQLYQRIQTLGDNNTFWTPVKAES